MQHVFIVSYGGSGFALVRHVLNGIDGFAIRGDTGGLLAPLVQSDLIVRQQRANPVQRGIAQGPGRATHVIDREKWRAERARVFSEAVLAPSPLVRVSGCTEVRCTPDEMDYRTFQATMDFLVEGFPNARLVFNRRNPVQAARSNWWQDTDEGQAREYITACNQRIADAHRRVGRDRSFILEYEDYDCRPDGFLPLLEWLGESIPPATLASLCADKPEELPLAPPAPSGRTPAAGAGNDERRTLFVR